METLLHDIRFGCRMLLKNPGFTVVAVITLALGIGANTAIFSFVNSLFLRPMPVDNPDRVVRLYAEEARGRKFDVFSYPNYADLRDRSKTLQALAAHGHVAASVGLGAGAENSEGELVTGNYFNALGINAALGRTPLPEDSQQGSFLGPSLSNDEIGRELSERNLPHKKFGSESELLREVADHAYRGNVSELIAQIAQQAARQSAPAGGRGSRRAASRRACARPARRRGPR